MSSAALTQTLRVPSPSPKQTEDAGPHLAEANPPSCPNANADVESVHATIATELLDGHHFTGRPNFWANITTCRLWSNLARKNGSPGDHSPLDLRAHKNQAAALWKPLPRFSCFIPSPWSPFCPGQGSRCSSAGRLPHRAAGAIRPACRPTRRRPPAGGLRPFRARPAELGCGT